MWSLCSRRASCSWWVCVSVCVCDNCPCFMLFSASLYNALHCLSQLLGHLCFFLHGDYVGVMMIRLVRPARHQRWMTAWSAGPTVMFCLLCAMPRWHFRVFPEGKTLFTWRIACCEVHVWKALGRKKSDILQFSCVNTVFVQEDFPIHGLRVALWPLSGCLDVRASLLSCDTDGCRSVRFSHVYKRNFWNSLVFNYWFVDQLFDKSPEPTCPPFSWAVKSQRPCGGLKVFFILKRC